MIKTYRLRTNMNNVSHVLLGKNGNSVRYNFTNGNVATSKNPTLTLRTKYAQDLLEESDLFKNGSVILDQVVKEASDEVQSTTKSSKTEESTTETNVAEIVVEDVKTVADAVDYIAENYGKKVTGSKGVIAFANKNNLSFPNMVIE